jgi:hypothetical protein
MDIEEADYEDQTLEELSERLVAVVVNDDDEVWGELDELGTLVENESWGSLGRCMGIGSDEIFEELAEAGVEPNAWLAYMVAQEVRVVWGFKGLLDTMEVLVSMRGRVLESLHTRLIEALVEAEPFPDSLAALVNAWREEALKLAPDVMSLADGALAGDIKHLLDTAHRIADPPGYYDQEDPPGWHEINGVASEIQIQLK